MKQLLQRIRQRWRLVVGVAFVAGLIAVNTVAWLHARAMSRFVRSGERTASPEKLGALAKAGVLLTGVTLVRPENRRTPGDFGLEFQSVRFPGAKGIQLEAWFIPANTVATNGVALLFHGYGASKESLLPVAAEFHKLGWSALLVDFHGSGGSSGDTTSAGWHEAEDVAAAFAEAARLAPGTRRVRYGASMGAAACLRAIHTLGLKPDALVMECPFDRMLTTVRSRFRAMRVPSWPFAELLVFWGGRQGGFDAFAHNPVDFARAVTCPVLLMHGAKDPRVSVEDIGRIHAALPASARLHVFPTLGHQSYVESRPVEWRRLVAQFLAHSEATSVPTR
ncbi:MAG: alpha/beta hydrolase [Limisphaerales bacterium]